VSHAVAPVWLAQSVLPTHATHMFVAVLHAGMPVTLVQSVEPTHCTHWCVVVLHTGVEPVHGCPQG
jgi:hypothetical protein